MFDAERREFYFLEVNTRLQVEHGVTELVMGVDLVEWMIRTAAGDPPDLSQFRGREPRGHAIQVRVYAEDPAREFKPSSGLLTEVKLPDVRVEVEYAATDRWRKGAKAAYDARGRLVVWAPDSPAGAAR